MNITLKKVHQNDDGYIEASYSEENFGKDFLNKGRVFLNQNGYDLMEEIKGFKSIFEEATKLSHANLYVSGVEVKEKDGLDIGIILLGEIFTVYGTLKLKTPLIAFDIYKPRAYLVQKVEQLKDVFQTFCEHSQPMQLDLFNDAIKIKEFPSATLMLTEDSGMQTVN